MIYIIHGEDSFRAGLYIKEELLKAKASGAQVGVFEASGELDGALSFLARPGLFDVPRIVIIRSIERLPEVKRSALEAAFRASGFEKVEEKSFPILRGLALKRWLEDYAASLGIMLDDGVGNFLLEVLGNDSGRIAVELEKLATYKPNGTIKFSDLEILSPQEIPEKTLYFAWVDGFLARDEKQALRGLVELLAAGVDPIQLLTALTNTLRTLLIIKHAKSRAEVSRSVGSAHPFWISKLTIASRRFSVTELKKLYSQVLKAEYLLKSGRIDAEPLLEEIVMTVASNAAVPSPAEISSD